MMTTDFDHNNAPVLLPPSDHTAHFLISPILLLAQLCLLGFCTPAIHAGTNNSPPELGVESVASGFDYPIDMDVPPGDSSRLFVCEKARRRVRILDLDTGVILPTPFLDLSSIASNGSEQGLLGLEFHPDYGSNGRFFVSYVANGGNSRLVEYRVSPANPDVADPVPVQFLLTVDQPYSNNNGELFAFGLDGKLFISFGDGGSVNDPGNRAQDGTSLLGKILRLDVDLPAPFVPVDNPFLDDPLVRDEVWALGVRNPEALAVDSATGDLWFPDNGTGSRNEVNFEPAVTAGGQNYGWRCMEGSYCTGLTGCDCNAGYLRLPLYEHGLTGGLCRLRGGVVYQGSSMPWLRGSYFFGDFCSSRIWSMRQIDGYIGDFYERTAELEPEGNPTIQSIGCIRVDAQGEILIADAYDGEVYRVVPRAVAVDLALTEVRTFVPHGYPLAGQQSYFVEVSGRLVNAQQGSANTLSSLELLDTTGQSYDSIDLPIYYDSDLSCTSGDCSGQCGFTTVAGWYSPLYCFLSGGVCLGCNGDWDVGNYYVTFSPPTNDLRLKLTRLDQTSFDPDTANDLLDFSLPGTNYCDVTTNSSGLPARIGAVGTASVSANNLNLIALPIPSGHAAFVYGSSATQVPYGQGFLCVAGTVGRTQLQSIGAEQRLRLALDLTQPPFASAFVPGSTWYFQATYREGQSFYRSIAPNFSDGYAITFLP